MRERVREEGGGGGRERWREEKGWRRGDKSVCVCGVGGEDAAAECANKKSERTNHTQKARRGKSVGGRRENIDAGVRQKRDEKEETQRTREREAENRRGWQEKWGERLRALHPAVKQDGGQAGTRWSPCEGAEQQGENRMRLEALHWEEGVERGGLGEGDCYWERGGGGGEEYSVIWMEQHRPVEKTTPGGGNCAFSWCPHALLFMCWEGLW